MTRIVAQLRSSLALLLALPLIALSGTAWGAIAGITGPAFDLTAKSDYISTGDGNSLVMWGYAQGDGVMQYPGPTLIVNQGDTVTVNLSNALPVTVSMVFPGQTGVTTTGGTPGLLTAEAAPGESVSYSFQATHPGTYLYHSGTHPGLQVEMGLVGALIVRPAAPDQAYDHPSTRFDREYLYLISEADKRVHEQVAFLAATGGLNDASAAAIDLTDYRATLWFINGRNAPDTMMDDFVPWLDTQPYGSMVRMFPGERVLLRMIGAGRDLHPIHSHGNHMLEIARDGRMRQSAPGIGADLARLDYTLKVFPGSTNDAIFTWTGQGLGWDVYGTVAEFPHTCTDGGDGFDAVTREYCADHDKPFPVQLPQQQDVAFGGFWTGSPFLGVFGALPPGEGGLNPNAGFTFMLHSHTEVELTNDDIFPGGMMTMIVIEPPNSGVEIP